MKPQSQEMGSIYHTTRYCWRKFTAVCRGPSDDTDLKTLPRGKAGEDSDPLKPEPKMRESLANEVKTGVVHEDKKVQVREISRRKKFRLS